MLERVLLASIPRITIVVRQILEIFELVSILDPSFSNHVEHLSANVRLTWLWMHAARARRKRARERIDYGSMHWKRWRRQVLLDRLRMFMAVPVEDSVTVFGSDWTICALQKIELVLFN